MSADDAPGIIATAEPAEGAGRYLGPAGFTAVAAFAVLVLRLFAVSGYNWETAFQVSTTIGLDDGIALVFGTLLAGPFLTAMLLILTVPLLFSAYMWGPVQRRPVAFLLTALGIGVMVALTATYQSWWLPAATVVMFSLFALIHRLLPKRRVRRLLMAAMSRASLVAGVGVLIIAGLIQTAWVPLEQIQTTDRIISGHVLSVDSGYLNVLTADHEFMIVLTKNVISRR